MENKYIWNILKIDNYQSLIDDNGVQFFDVIYAVQWQISSTDQNNNVAFIYDSIGFDIDLSNSYIPRNQITEEILIVWVKEKLGNIKIQELQNQIDEMLLNII